MMIRRDDYEIAAAALIAAGVKPTERAILAALRPPRAPEIEAEMARGYLDACERWERPIGLGVDVLDGASERPTAKPFARSDEKRSEAA